MTARERLPNWRLRERIEAGLCEPDNNLSIGNGAFGEEPPPPKSPEDYGAAHETNPKTLAPLQWLDMSKWDDVPVPERRWAIRDRVPCNQAGLFSGEGGAGKSIIELMKDAAHVTGKDWLKSMPEQGPAFYVGAEDEADELHRRLAAIAKHYGMTFKDLTDGGLRVLCLLGQDATLCAANGKSGKVETTNLYRQLYEAAGDLKPKNLSVDTLSRAFAGNEIDRVQVYGFAMHMQAMAIAAGGAVTVLSHPSLSGISTGTGLSGSTAWHGAFRFRQYLRTSKPEDGGQPNSDLRELEFKKNQYGPTGETILVRYQHGLFLPEGGISDLDKVAREQKANDIFLALLTRFQGEGRNVSEKQHSPPSPLPCSTRRRKRPVCAKTISPVPCAASSPIVKFTLKTMVGRRAPMPASRLGQGLSHDAAPL